MAKINIRSGSSGPVSTLKKCSSRYLVYSSGITNPVRVSGFFGSLIFTLCRKTFLFIASVFGKASNC